nr:MAG TPA: hypothetical protein [Caudoviricetes sp.]
MCVVTHVLKLSILFLQGCNIQSEQPKGSFTFLGVIVTQ